MFPRGEAGAGFAAGAALLVAALVFGFPDVFGTLVCLGAETRFFDFVFFAAFLTDFLPAFFVAGFFAALFAFPTTRLLFLARFFDAAALVVRARGDLRTFFAFFPEVFFLGVATTNSFMAQTGLLGLIIGGALPHRFREEPENGENQRFSFKIVFCGVTRGANDLFPHLRQPCKAGQVRVGIGVVGTQAFAHPAIHAVDERRECHPVAAAERVAEGVKFARIDPRQGGQQRRCALVKFEGVATK